MKIFENQVIWITGASAGIGEASAKAFARLGAKLLLISRRLERLFSLEKELSSQCEVSILACDVANPEDVFPKLDQLSDEWKTPDILLNNAGVARGMDKTWEVTPQQWDEVIDTNIKGVLNFCHFAVPLMLKKGRGHVINVSSVAGHETYPGGSIYCGTKHAVRSITDALRMELVSTPLRVSMISPGIVKTDFSLYRFAGDKQRAEKVYENIEALTAGDIAEAILFIASRPPHVNIADLIIYPTHQATPTIVHRNSE